MASSGTVTFGVNELDIITDALQSINVIGAGDPVEGADLTLARRKLNLIVKQWTGQIDFAPGLKLWHRRRAYLFLQSGEVEYDLGPSGDHATESYVQTTLSAGASGGASTISVTSASGISSTYNIGVELSSGATHWTTVNGAPSGTTVTLTASLPSAADSGAQVWVYATKIRRPFEILSAVVRDTTQAEPEDTPFDPHMSLEEYELLPTKHAEGSPRRGYFEAQRTNSKLFIECPSDTLTDIIRFVYLSYPEDFTGTTQDADFPVEWHRALIYQLAMDLCTPYGKEIAPTLKALRDESLSIARNAYPESVKGGFMTEPDCY